MKLIVIFLSAMLSVILPWALIMVRQSVKKQRQEVIKDLEAVFHSSNHHRLDEEMIIPSFEFVKFKYFLDHRKNRNKKNENNPKDFPFWVLMISSAPLSIMLFVFGLVAFGAIFVIAKEDIVAVVSESIGYYAATPTASPPPGQAAEALERAADALERLKRWDLMAVFIVAYLATYLFAIRELLRAISNFDFGPTTLLSSAVHVLFGVVTAIIIAVTAAVVLPDPAPNLSMGAAGAAIVLLAAFVVGFVPELGVRTLLRSTRLSWFKREDETVYESFKGTPLEVIDGIDSEVRSRLNLFNIGNVQNLATANPIMLFVETPYGVYQVIDWVAQAQLCSIVGPKRLTSLWDLGVRTIFDVEQAVLGPCSTPALRLEIGKRLLADNGDGVLNPAAGDTSDKNIIALANMMLDDLHIHRLRQIVNRIAQRLGPENARLKFSKEPCAPKERKEESTPVA